MRNLRKIAAFNIFVATLGLAPLTFALAPSICAAGQAVELLGVAQLAGTATDQSGLNDQLADSTPHNRLGGLSAIEYSGANDLYFVLSDRGPKDGSVPYRCRWHSIELKAPRTREGRASAHLVDTTLLSAADGKPYIGLSSAFQRAGASGGYRFDPEGIRRGPSGSLFVSDEYGPFIIEFNPNGHALRSLPVPARFLIQHPSASKEEEIANNSSGRISNSGFEALAISPDGERLYAVIQLPLLQDSEPAKSGKRKGMNCRLLEIHLKSDATREFVYRLDRPQNKVSEIVASAPGRFLVIERDGEIGDRAAFKRIMAIDLRNASDASGIDSLPATSLPPGVKPVQKTTFVDLLDRRFGLVGPQCPEKQEGLAWGPTLPDGRSLLWICVDNDFKPASANLFYAFAVPAGFAKD